MISPPVMVATGPDTFDGGYGKTMQEIRGFTARLFIIAETSVQNSPDAVATTQSGPAAPVFRQHGYASETEEILVAQRRQARRANRSRKSFPRRALDAAYGASVGYGWETQLHHSHRRPGCQPPEGTRTASAARVSVAVRAL